ncbi:hypothetical protein QJQ45_005034 [Haematococcus lacustris]|nr:hypothetical protein QJQ45_005034 [Haematococcus lacustris]
MPAPPMPRGKQLLHCGNTELDAVKHQFTQAPTLAVPGTVTSPLVLYPPTASNSHPDLPPVHTQHMSPQHSHTFPTSPGQSPKFQGGRPWRASLDPGPHSPPPLQPAPHAASLRAAEQQTLPPLTWLRQALEGGGPVDLHGDASTAMGGIVPGMRASMPAAARLPGLMGAATSPGRKKRSNEAAVAELEDLIGHMVQPLRLHALCRAGSSCVRVTMLPSLHLYDMLAKPSLNARLCHMGVTLLHKITSCLFRRQEH